MGAPIAHNIWQNKENLFIVSRFFLGIYYQFFQHQNYLVQAYVVCASFKSLCNFINIPHNITFVLGNHWLYLFHKFLKIRPSEILAKIDSRLILFHRILANLPLHLSCTLLENFVNFSHNLRESIFKISVVQVRPI